MALHASTFEYLKPTDEEMRAIEQARSTLAELAVELDNTIPDGPDKTYLLRQLRDYGTGANAAIARNPDGSPRTWTSITVNPEE